MLRGDSGLRAVHVWPHVSLLPGLGYTFLIDIPPHLIFSSLVRSAAMEGSGRGHLSNVPGANPGCHQDLQVSVEYCMSSSSGLGPGQVTVM